MKSSQSKAKSVLCTVSVASHLRRCLRSSATGVIIPKFCRSEIDKQATPRLKKILIVERLRQATEACNTELEELNAYPSRKPVEPASPDERQTFERSSSGAGPSSSGAGPSSSIVVGLSPSAKLKKRRANKAPMSASPLDKVSGDGSRWSKLIYVSPDNSPIRPRRI